MPGPYHGLLYIKDRSGGVHEVINHARTSAYLSNPALAFNGISICDVIDLGGCATYGLAPRCSPVGGWIEFPGISGNSASIPDAAPLDILGDITLIAKVQMADWTPANDTTVFGKGDTYRMVIRTNGELQLIWTDSSVVTHAEVVAGGSANDYVAANGWLWLALTLDVNNGASGHTVRAWRSTTGKNWTQLGPDRVVATTTNIRNGTEVLTIGAGPLFRPVNVANVLVYSGIGLNGYPKQGTGAVFNFDGPANLVGVADGATSVTATTGQTITVAYSGGTNTNIITSVPISSWSAYTLNKPATDPAPWYNANYPESADALGFFIEEWTGLDDAHVKRPTTPWSGFGGGSQLGGVSAEGRTMAINLLLFGRTEEAVEYLFRWFASVMTGVCQTCATDSILIRRFCGSAADPWKGMAELRKVGLIAGAKWESEPFGRAACFLRRASITLMAGDPCMYLPDTDRAANAADYVADLHTCFAGTNSVDPTRELCRPSCSELDLAACRASYTFSVNPLGVIAPIITWQNSMAQYSFPFRAVVYADPGNIGTSPNPCGLPILGELYVRALPPSMTLRWDVAAREIQVRDSTTGGFTSGVAYIEPNDPPQRRFFAVPCGQAHLVMEPASVCIANPTGDTWTLDELTFDPPAFPTVDIRLQERVSCP